MVLQRQGVLLVTTREAVRKILTAFFCIYALFRRKAPIETTLAPYSRLPHDLLQCGGEVRQEPLLGSLIYALKGEIGVQILQLHQEQRPLPCPAGVDTLDAVADVVPVDEGAGEGQIRL